MGEKNHRCWVAICISLRKTLCWVALGLFVCFLFLETSQHYHWPMHMTKVVLSFQIQSFIPCKTKGITLIIVYLKEAGGDSSHLDIQPNTIIYVIQLVLSRLLSCLTPAQWPFQSLLTKTSLLIPVSLICVVVFLVSKILNQSWKWYPKSASY